MPTTATASESIQDGGLCNFTLAESYELAVKFMREKDGSKAITLGYAQKLQYSALLRQATNGPFKEEAAPEVGLLDVVGMDRREAWRQLGDMTREQAMLQLIELVNGLTPLFLPFLEAHRVSRMEQDRAKQEVAISQDQKSAENEVLARQAVEYQRWLEHEASLRAALNVQTAEQFQQYAEQQYPGEVERQSELIRQLQEQHFQHYMAQWYQQQQAQQSMLAQQHQQQTQAPSQNIETAVPSSSASNGHDAQGALSTSLSIPPVISVNSAASSEPQSALMPPIPSMVPNGTLAVPGSSIDGAMDQAGGPPTLPPVRLWNHKNIKQFKDTISKENKDAVLKIGSGESITIRVPTNDDATSLYWEFSTDSYDVGFGVFFEWQTAPDDQVRIEVSDSEEEEEGEGETDGEHGHDDTNGGGNTSVGDVEKGSGSGKRNKNKDGPLVDELVPLARRDSHLEVYCGSHDFAPHRGVYLLRFDNSFSLWRSKTLYYRIFYAK